MVELSLVFLLFINVYDEYRFMGCVVEENIKNIFCRFGKLKI